MMTRQALAPLCALFLLGACVPPDLTPAPDTGSTVVGDMAPNVQTDLGNTGTADIGGGGTDTGGNDGVDMGGMADTGGGGFGGKNPFEGQATAIMEGKDLYDTNQCVGCHGPQGELMTFGNGAVIKETGDTKMDDYIFDKISNGVSGKMQAYKDILTEENDIWKIVTFIRSL